MIISHRHRFCFFAIPRTGSTAVARALLRAGYGEEVKPQHISYEEFMTGQTRDVRSYFTFTIVRNPLDSVVSAYFKKKNDHNGRFSRGTFKSGRPIAPRQLEAYRFIRDNDASFAEYFRKFHTAPYRLPRHEATAAAVDKVLRFERLAADLNETLAALNLPALAIPRTNPTAGRKSDFTQYYTPPIRSLAQRNFSDIMESWGYDFPESWDIC